MQNTDLNAEMHISPDAKAEERDFDNTKKTNEATPPEDI